MHARQTHTKKAEMVDKIRNTIILCIRDKVIELTWNKTIFEMWVNLESFYMTKFLAYNLTQFVSKTTLFFSYGGE